MKVIKTLIIVTAIFLSACNDQIEANMSEPMVDFEFITQDEDKLNLESLEGEWWIANFMYTNCRTICPTTTVNLSKAQQELSHEGFHPQIVSFSVDPTQDTPEVLKEYAGEYDVNLDTWSFLTGYDFETIQKISEGTFNTVLRKGGADQFSHGFHFYLINPEGEIVKRYDGTSNAELQVLIEDITTVL